MQERRNSPKGGGKLRVLSFLFFSFSLLTLFYVCDSFEDEAETKNRAEIVLFQREEIRFIIIRCGFVDGM